MAADVKGRCSLRWRNHSNVLSLFLIMLSIPLTAPSLQFGQLVSCLGHASQMRGLQPDGHLPDHLRDPRQRQSAQKEACTGRSEKSV